MCIVKYHVPNNGLIMLKFLLASSVNTFFSVCKKDRPQYQHYVISTYCWGIT